MKWRLLIAAILGVSAMTTGLWIVGTAAMLFNNVNPLLGVVVLVGGIGLTAILAAWVIEKILFWGTE